MALNSASWPTTTSLSAKIPLADVYLDTQSTCRNGAEKEIAFPFCKIF